MRYIFISLMFILGAAFLSQAQDVSAVELQIERLRTQLRNVIDLESRLQDRAARLDEDLGPESIGRSVATGDTTDAAVLRTRRRGERRQNHMRGRPAPPSPTPLEPAGLKNV